MALLAMPEMTRRRGVSLSLRGVTAGAGGATLGPVDLDLGSGAYGCLFGPPGAGKTLWLRAVAGLVRARGILMADGTALPRRRHGFALLAQNGAAMPYATVTACLAASQAARGTPRRDRGMRRAALLVEWALDGSADPARLDPDTTLRLRLACAIASTPVLLLLDDPLAACIDRRAIIDRLRAIGPAITVLHATTQRDDAFALADQLIVLHAGRVLQAGSAAAVYEHPDTLDIARRVGLANVLPGRIIAIENDLAQVRLDCGPLIEAEPPANPAAADTACQVLLRPERISVSPIASAELGVGAIAAVLRDVTQLGDTIRLTLALGADAEIVVARPAGLGARGLLPGRTVSVAWQSRHALTFIAPS